MLRVTDVVTQTCYVLPKCSPVVTQTQVTQVNICHLCYLQICFSKNDVCDEKNNFGEKWFQKTTFVKCHFLKKRLLWRLQSRKWTLPLLACVTFVLPNVRSLCLSLFLYLSLSLSRSLSLSFSHSNPDLFKAFCRCQKTSIREFSSGSREESVPCTHRLGLDR